MDEAYNWVIINGSRYEMTLKDAVKLVYDLVRHDITENSDSEYQVAQQVIEKFIEEK